MEVVEDVEEKGRVLGRCPDDGTPVLYLVLGGGDDRHTHTPPGRSLNLGPSRRPKTEGGRKEKGVWYSFMSYPQFSYSGPRCDELKFKVEVLAIGPFNEVESDDVRGVDTLPKLR